MWAYFSELPFVRSVGHVSDFLCLPQFSSGRLPSFPSSALLLWLEEQPAGSQPQQPAHRQAVSNIHTDTHTNISRCVTETTLLWPLFYIHTQHILTSCSCASLFQRQVKLLLSFLSRVAADYTEIKNDFMASRDSLPIMFIATPKDKKQSMWTKRAPSIQVSGHTNTSTRLTQPQV